ncbi:heavy metal-binding domain-containing protein [Massilia sp. CCM 8695]|uniref:Heavy metal-binding domain-containing protein n=1 Tax=Massilia frigida TaxID=2609281 RepID=A0ABX0NGX7_9BURK|nr:heavy metal-binding domain-containing protein [Massilia frigida]NHZ82326.1 heavy metal-binding domain-containing protein [Massilia frigida]
MGELVAIGFWLGLVVIGYIFGRAAEAKHYRSILSREKAWLHLPSTSLKTLLDPARPVERSELVYGNVVVSIDYFKQAVLGLRSFIGGAVTSHETLVDRARREAVLRLKESCPDAHEIVNLRLEAMAISGKTPGSVASVEMLAYGTAIYFAK